MFSRTGTYPGGQPPTLPRDSSEGVIAQAICTFGCVIVKPERGARGLPIPYQIIYGLRISSNFVRTARISCHINHFSCLVHGNVCASRLGEEWLAPDALPYLTSPAISWYPAYLLLGCAQLRQSREYSSGQPGESVPWFAPPLLQWNTVGRVGGTNHIGNVDTSCSGKRA